MASAIAGQHVQEVLLQIQQACQQITVKEQQARSRCRDAEVERWFAEAMDNYGLASEYPASYDLDDEVGIAPDIRGLLLQAARACERPISPKRNSTRRPEGLNSENFQSPGKNALDPAFASVCSPSKHAKTAPTDAKSPIDERVLRVPSPTRAHCHGPKPQRPDSQESSLTGTCSGSHMASTMARKEVPQGESERSTSKLETQTEGTVLRSTQAGDTSSAMPHASSGSSGALITAERSNPGLRVPAAFAQRPCQEPTEELDSLRPPSSGAPAWQSSALFAKPPPSPRPEKETLKNVAENAKTALPRPPATAQQGLPESQAGAKLVSGHLNSQAASNKVEGAKMPDNNQTTPAKSVRERIAQFDRGSTPNQRPLGSNTAGPTPNRMVASASRMSGSVGKSAALGNPGSAVPGSASAAIDGSSMFTPQQRPPQQVSGEVKPKTLFKSASEAVPTQATSTASRSSASTSATKAPPRPVNAAGGGIRSSASAVAVGGSGGGVGGLHGSSSAASLPPARDVGSLKTPTLFPSSSQSSISQSGSKAPDGGRLDSTRNAQTDACDRLASGRPRDNLEKPKSLQAAAQARMQEEKRQRERQEREQEREKARAATAAAAHSTAPVPSNQSRAALDPRAPCPDTPASASSQTIPSVNPAGQSEASACQSSATASKSQLGQCPTAPAQGRPGSAKLAGAAPAGGVAPEPIRVGSSRVTEKNLPAVPVFTGAPDMSAAQLLRQIVLQPKNPADNYELSEYDGDSDAEDTTEKDQQRARKRLPAWSENYLDLLQKQADIDPSSIFGEGAPKCSMDEIFPTSLYSLVGKTRPKRARGSSGDWRRDRLTKTEIHEYRRKMGQQRNWNVETRPKSTAIGAAGSGQH